MIHMNKFIIFTSLQSKSEPSTNNHEPKKKNWNFWFFFGFYTDLEMNNWVAVITSINIRMKFQIIGSRAKRETDKKKLFQFNCCFIDWTLNGEYITCSKWHTIIITKWTKAECQTQIQQLHSIQSFIPLANPINWQANRKFSFCFNRVTFTLEHTQAQAQAQPNTLKRCEKWK